MKKAVVFVIFAMLVIGSCAAQSTNNDAQRLVGTWVSQDGKITFVFNANGTGTASGLRSEMNGSIFWGVSTSGGLYVYYAGGGYGSSEASDLYFSLDGKRMIYHHTVYQKK